MKSKAFKTQSEHDNECESPNSTPIIKIRIIRYIFPEYFSNRSTVVS